MARVAPTFVTEVETAAWNTSPASKATATFDVLDGDVLVAYAMMENGNTTTDSVTLTAGGGFSWTSQEECFYAGAPNNNGYARIWTAIADSNQTAMTVTFTREADPLTYGGGVVVFRDSDGIGATHEADNATGTTDPALSLASTADASAMVCAIGDWTASESARTWNTVNSVAPSVGNGYEVAYYADSAAYGIHAAYWPDVGATGSDSYGMTDPSQRWAMVLVEVLGSEEAAPWDPEVDSAKTMHVVSAPRF